MVLLLKSISAGPGLNAMEHARPSLSDSYRSITIPKALGSSGRNLAPLPGQVIS